MDNKSNSKLLLRDYSPIRDEKIIDICRNIQSQLDKSNDVIVIGDLKEKKSPKVFGKYNGGYWTKGYVGVLQYNGEQIVIGSRFDDNESQDFLYYVFAQYFDTDVKILKKQNVTGSKDNLWDEIFVIVFIRQLKEALKKGYFRQYRQYAYNDAKIRGQIDIARHIRENPIDNGRIAYKTREYTVDNIYNILILKTYNVIEKRYGDLLRKLTENEICIRKGIQQLRMEIPNWNTIRIPDILNGTRKKIVHSVYKKYEPLRVTSRMILKRLGLDVFGTGRENVSGVLFDMAHVWEKFIHKTIFDSLDWNTNNSKEKIPVLNGKRKFEPDFYWKKQKIVFDAKYKIGWEKAFEDELKGKLKGEWPDGVREDIFQVFAYMLSFECKVGGVIFPYKWDGEDVKDIEWDVIMKPFSVFPNEQSEKSEQNEKVFYRIPYYIPQENLDEKIGNIQEKMKERIKNMPQQL